MLDAAPVSFIEPIGSGIALALGVGVLAAGKYRRIHLPRISGWLLIGGMLCLIAAAGRPVWKLAIAPRIAVMVDLSPSTRGAGFRDAAAAAVRLHELIGSDSVQWIAFASENRPLDPTDAWTEMNCDQTHFSPPDADAIILFSDAQFDLPESSPPVFVVADAGLENVADAGVERLEIRGQDLVASINDTGGPRYATFSGTSDPTLHAALNASVVLSRPLRAGADLASVQLNGGDLWPENDALFIRVSPPLASELWWIGGRTPGKDFVRLTPDQIPTDPARYLAPAAIVLDNIAAADFSEAALDRLTQYVRDLGGSLLILGGDHALGAGAYRGTALEALGPLASAPPGPVDRWIILADASGSMSQMSGSTTLFDQAGDAIARLMPGLPPDDPVLVGQFSDVVRWWSKGKNARETSHIALPPPDAAPRGPTNLEASLNQIAAENTADLPTQLLVLSDCDTTFQKPDDLASLLRHKNIRLHVLALGNGRGLAAIRGIVRTTGGNILEQFDPTHWVASARQLTQAAEPQSLGSTPVTVRFMGEAAALGSVAVLPPWNRAWLKQGATQWTDVAVEQPLAAFWRVGDGCVAAAGFSPDLASAEAMAHLVAARPHDPRFSVAWETGRNLTVRIDAAEGGRFLNDLKFTLEIAGHSSRQITVPQTAPGEYRASIPAPRQPAIVTLRHDGTAVDRIAVAGRYAPEFDALGNDHESMRRLAERSGGAVIWPADHARLELPHPVRNLELTPWLCGAGAILLGFAIVALLAGR